MQTKVNIAGVYNATERVVLSCLLPGAVICQSGICDDCILGIGAHLATDLSGLR